jgi:hypothetical protein
MLSGAFMTEMQQLRPSLQTQTASDPQCTLTARPCGRFEVMTDMNCAMNPTWFKGTR